MKLKKSSRGFIFSLLFGYFFFGALLYFKQKSFVYYPDNRDFESCPEFFGYEKINHQGTRFYFRQNSENLVVFYHGNAGSACDRGFLRPIFEKNNFSLIFVEYAGYSNDSRQPSAELILNDVHNVINFIQNNNFNKIIVIGESLGTGPASFHVKSGKVDYLALVAAFPSLKEVARSKFPIYPTSLMLKENYDNEKWLENFRGQALFFHGQRDLVISPRLSRKLFEKTPTEEKDYWLIEKAGHDDIWISHTFQSKLADFLSAAAR